MNIPEMIRETVNADARLTARGRFLDVVMLMHLDDETWRFDILRGRIVTAETGPFVMPASTFCLRAPADEWRAFWQPVPRPGHHDIFALMKRRVLQVGGDLHPLMANLFYFKTLLATPRGRI